MDWGNASAGWVVEGDANVSGWTLTANSCPEPGQAFYRPAATLAPGRRIEIDGTLTASFSIRFAAGYHDTGKVDVGSLEAIRDVLEAFGKQRPCDSHPHLSAILLSAIFIIIIASRLLFGVLLQRCNQAGCPLFVARSLCTRSFSWLVSSHAYVHVATWALIG